MIPHWLRKFSRWVVALFTRPKKPKPSRKPERRRPLGMEGLEGRWTPALAVPKDLLISYGYPALINQCTTNGGLSFDNEASETVFVVIEKKRP